jgi:hypothetical protein
MVVHLTLRSFFKNDFENGKYQCACWGGYDNVDD